MVKIDYTKISNEELQEKQEILNLELIKAQVYVKRLGQSPKLQENPKKVRTIKKEIARIQTEKK